MNIPFFPNTGDGTHCFQAALMMALGFFWPDKKFTHDELDRISGKLPGKWTWPTTAMVWMMKNGLKVGLIEEFSYSEFAARGADYIIDRYGKEVGLAQIQNSDIKREQKIAAEFVKLAPVEYRVPSTADIKKCIDNNEVVIVNLNSAMLYNAKGYSGHFVVICNVDEKFVTLHDPGLPPNPNFKVPIARFNLAWGYPTERDKSLMKISA